MLKTQRASLVLAALLVPLAACGSDEDASTGSDDTVTTTTEAETMSLSDLADALEQAQDGAEFQVVTIDDVSPTVRPCFAASELLAYAYGVPIEAPESDPTDAMGFFVNELPEELQASGSRLVEMVAPIWDDSIGNFSMSELAALRETPEYAEAVEPLEDLSLNGCKE